jgi:hypothetical protein
MKNRLNILLTIFFVASILVFTIKGVLGNPTPDEIYNKLRSEGMPFELSPERGRYALLTSVVDHKSVIFPLDVAQYVVPDLGYIDGKYVSLFAPGVSYLAIPLYLVGKSFNVGQLAAFSLSSIFTVLNFYLISEIVRKVTKNRYAGLLSAMIFVFGTSAFSYAITLYQHSITTFLILLSLRLLQEKKSKKLSFIIGSIFAISIFFEYPNAVFLMSILLSYLFRFININNTNGKVFINISLKFLYVVLGALLLLIPSFFYNYKAYGDPLQIASTLRRAEEINVDPETSQIISPAERFKVKSAFGFFDINRFPTSMSVLLTSKDRGILIFSPVVAMSFLGLYFVFKKDRIYFCTLLSTFASIIFLYGMWGDPWGGWSFGSRYLIPAVAILSIFLGVAISKFGHRVWFLLLFFITSIYSIAVNLSGALTTIQIPPSVEEISGNYPKFIFIHNFKLLSENKSSSFAYNSFLSDYINLLTFYFILLLAISLVGALFFLSSYKLGKD